MSVGVSANQSLLTGCLFHWRYPPNGGCAETRERVEWISPTDDLMKLFSLLAASTLLVAPVSANTLYPDPYNRYPQGGTGTYNGGSYSEIDANGYGRNTMYDRTIYDNNTGTYYDCGTQGRCYAR